MLATFCYHEALQALMYTLYEHGSVIASTVRTHASREALRRAVKPGSVVLDIGTGTGILAFFACQSGARKVYAIEASDVIEVARETAELNGLADRIEFIQDLSTQVTLPEQVDVIVSDLHSVLPMHETSIASIIDARRRFLAPNGNIIPLYENLWAAVVSDPDFYQSFVGAWANEIHGLNMQNIAQRVTNTWRRRNTALEELVTEPQRWAALDYTQIEDANVAGNLTWNISKQCLAHGLSVWFDSTLIDGTCFSSAPGRPSVIYGQGFFPWPEPVSLNPGDVVATTLRAAVVGSECIWTWNTSISREGKEVASFRQSTFQGAVVPSHLLFKRR